MTEEEYKEFEKEQNRFEQAKELKGKIQGLDFILESILHNGMVLKDNENVPNGIFQVKMFAKKEFANELKHWEFSSDDTELVTRIMSTLWSYYRDKRAELEEKFNEL